MKKQTLAVFIVTLACLLVTISVFFVYDYLRPVSTIERVSHIQFPKGSSQIDAFDNLEYLVTAHVKIPDTKILDFINNNNLSSELPEEFKGLNYTPSTIQLRNFGFQVHLFKPENQELPPNAELFFLYGKNEFNCWVYVLDKNSGRMWVVAFYPDWGGDLSCR